MPLFNKSRVAHLNGIKGRVAPLNRIKGRVVHLNRIKGRVVHLNRIKGRVVHLNRIKGSVAHLNRINEIFNESLLLLNRGVRLYFYSVQGCISNFILFRCTVSLLFCSGMHL